MFVQFTGPAPITAVAFTADGWNILAGSKVGQVFQISSDGSQQIVVESNQIQGPILSFVNSNIGDECLVVGPKKYVTLKSSLTVNSHQQIQPAIEHEEYTSWLSLPPSILILGTGSVISPKPGYFRLYDQSQKRYLGANVPEKGGVRSLAALASTQTVAWATGDRQIVIWEIAKPDRTRISFQHTSPSIAFNHDGQTLAAAMEWNVILLEWKAKRERLTLKAHKGRVTTVAYALDGTLFTGSWDGLVKIWDTAGREIRSFDFQQGRITCLAIAADGSRAAVGTDRGNIVIWDLI